MPRSTKPLTGDFDDPGDGATPTGGALVPFNEKGLDAAILASAGANDIAREIAQGILNGQTVDEILGSVDPTESLVGVIFRPIEWKFGHSTFGDKKGAFVVMKVVDAEGRERVVTSGAPNVLAALRAFEKAEVDIPALTMREAVTSNGFTTYRLAKARAA